MLSLQILGFNGFHLLSFIPLCDCYNGEIIVFFRGAVIQWIVDVAWDTFLSLRRRPQSNGRKIAIFVSKIPSPCYHNMHGLTTYFNETLAEFSAASYVECFI